MTTCHCENIIRWGDVATWVAGLGSLLAVIVALGVSIWTERKEYFRRQVEVASMATTLRVEFEIAKSGLRGSIDGFKRTFQGYKGVLGPIGWHADSDYSSIRALNESVKRVRFEAIQHFLPRLSLFDEPDATDLSEFYVIAVSFQRNQDLTPQDLFSMDVSSLQNTVNSMLEQAAKMADAAAVASERMSLIRLEMRGRRDQLFRGTFSGG